METAHVEAPEVKEEAALSLREKLGLAIDTVRQVKIKKELTILYNSDLGSMDLDGTAYGYRAKFKREGNTIELSSTRALDDQDELTTAITAEWSWEAEQIVFASAYQSHISGGREITLRQWDPNCYPKPEGQMGTSEVLSELMTLSNQFLVR